MRYAANTTVSSEKSRGEIERVLVRYGARAFSYGWEDRGGDALAAVGFRTDERSIRFMIPMPSREEFRFTPARGTERSPAAIDKEFDQACRQRWRALLLVIKAKLEAVDAGISTFEEEFLAHIVMPNGQTVSQMALPEIAKAYRGGQAPRLLLSAGEAP